MKTLIIVLAAVLFSITAQATESLVSCFTPQETVEKVRKELSGEVEVYGLQIVSSDTHRGLYRGWLRGRKAKHPDSKDANISSNLMLAAASIENGLCTVKFSFDRSMTYCRADEDRRSGCHYEKMHITFSGDFLNADGTVDADFYYKNPESGQSLLAKALGLKSEIPAQARSLKCHADRDLVRDLCQKKQDQVSGRSVQQKGNQ